MQAHFVEHFPKVRQADLELLEAVSALQVVDLQEPKAAAAAQVHLAKASAAQAGQFVGPGQVALLQERTVHWVAQVGQVDLGLPKAALAAQVGQVESQLPEVLAPLVP